MRTLLIACSLALVGAAGCATLAGDRAPAAVTQVDAERLYNGRWLEVARRPMLITHNCGHGGTDYVLNPDRSVRQYDYCRVGGADGEVRVLETRAQPRFAPNGEFLGMVGVNEDVTGRAGLA